MNFIQTYWSSPTRTKTGDSLDRHNGGWVAEKFHALSWAYSILSLRKHHPNDKFKLYTDPTGADWLINQLGLPYDEVILSTDKLSAYPPNLWAMAKVQSYSLQNEPFLHVDGDVYIWKPFPQELLRKHLIAQHVELNNTMYWKMLTESKIYLKGTPSFYDSCKSVADIYAFGAGIFGGNDLDLIKTYCEKCFEFVDTNLEIFKRAEDPGVYNMFFEQSFIANMAKDKYGSWDNVGFVYSEKEVTIYHMTRFTLVPRSLYLMHMCGSAKVTLPLLNHLEQRFQFEFPKMAQKIQDIYATKDYHFLSHKEEILDDAKTLHYTNRCLNELLNKDGDSTNKFSNEAIEEILSKNIDNPDYFDLWDFYHIESISRKLLDSAQINRKPKWDLLYNESGNDFLETPFSINWNNCDIIYLYNDWKVELDKEKQELSIEKPDPEENTGTVRVAENTLQPYLLSSHLGSIDLAPVAGWNKLFHLFDEENFLSGNQIIEKLKTLENFQFDSSTIKDNIYFFLSTQYFIHNRLLPNDHI
jgi:hypothetical protein